METPSGVEVVEVIFVSTRRGSGSPEDPIRCVYQYWAKDGRLLAELDTLLHDPIQSSYYAVKHRMQLRAAGGATASVEDAAHA